jgi:integrase
MATIQKYKTKGDEFRWRVRWTDREGNQKSKSFDRHKDAAAFKTSVENSLREGTYVAPSRMTIKELLDEWLPYHTDKKKLEHNTIKGYKLNIKHICAHLGRIAIQNIKPADIERMYGKLNHLSGKSLRYIHSTLNLAFKYAIKNKIIKFNPMDEVDIPALTKFEASFIEPSMVGEYLKLFEDAWIYPAVVLSMFCGLRRGELLALKWSDINFKTMKINVSHSAYEVNCELVIKKPKNNKPRDVGMDPSVAVLLKKYRRQQNENKMLLGDSYIDSDFVIREDNGKRPMPSYMSRFFFRRIKSSKLPHIRFHDLRHTSGSLMLYEGTDLKVVSVILGHSSIKTTGDIYAHIIEQQKRKAANSIGKYLR